MNKLNILVKKITNSRLSIPCILMFIFGILFIPYIINGGFIIDDWGVVANNYNNDSFLSLIKSWFPLFSNRPLAPIFISITGKLFGINPLGYIISTLFFWLGSICIIGYILKYYFGRNFSIFFISISAVPIIASTVIFSPAMQMTATISCFFYSLALLFLHKFLQNSKKKFYFLTYIFILIALLTYEVILPLLVLLFFLPYIKKEDISFKKYLLKYGLPLILILLIIIIYQKVIMPHFMVVYSRFNPATDIILICHLAIKWIYSFSIAPLLLFIKAIKSTLQYSIPLSSSLPIIGACYLLGFLILRNKETTDKLKSKKNILLILILTFLANFFMFTMSSSSPDTFGYDNRGLSITWITISLILAYIGSVYKNKIITILLLFIICLSWLTFIGERDSYIDSYKTQIAITKDAIKLVHQNNIPEEALVFGNVPQYLSNSFNREDLFNNEWDFGNALYLYSDKYIKRGNTITAKKIYNKLVESQNDQVIIDGYSNFSYKNLWFYNYDSKTGISSLKKIDNKKNMDETIIYIEKNYEIGKKEGYSKIVECLKKIKEMTIINFKYCFFK